MRFTTRYEVCGAAEISMPYRKEYFTRDNLFSVQRLYRIYLVGWSFGAVGEEQSQNCWPNRNVCWGRCDCSN